ALTIGTQQRRHGRSVSRTRPKARPKRCRERSRQSNFTNDFLNDGIGPNRIERWRDLRENQVIRALLVHLLCGFPGGIHVTNGIVNEPEMIWRNIALLRKFLKLVHHLDGIITSAGQTVYPSSCT